MELGEQIKFFLKHTGISQEEAAKRLGITRQTLSNYLKMAEVPKDFIKKVESEFGFTEFPKIYTSYDFGKTNLTEAVREGALPPIKYDLSNEKKAESDSVPVYDTDFHAGVLTSLTETRDPAKMMAQLSIPEVAGCDAVIRARGDSMADFICDRDWIGIKRVYDMDVLLYGNPYAIVTDELQIIKYIRKGASKDTILIRSHNEYYEDFELPISKIRELYLVKAVLPFSKIKTLA